MKTMNNFLASRLEVMADIREGVKPGIGANDFVEDGREYGFLAVMVRDKQKRNATILNMNAKEDSVLFSARGAERERDAFEAITEILRASKRVLYVERTAEDLGFVSHGIEFRTNREKENISRAVQLFVGHYRTKVLKEPAGFKPSLVDMCNDVPDEFSVHGLVYTLQTLGRSGTSYEFVQMGTAPGQPVSNDLGSDLRRLLRRQEVFETGSEGYVSPTALPIETKFDGDLSYLGRVVCTGVMFGAKKGADLVPLTEKIAGYISMNTKNKEVPKYVKQLAEHWK